MNHDADLEGRAPPDHERHGVARSQQRSDLVEELAGVELHVGVRLVEGHADRVTAVRDETHAAANTRYGEEWLVSGSTGSGVLADGQGRGCCMQSAR